MAKSKTGAKPGVEKKAVAKKVGEKAAKKPADGVVIDAAWVAAQVKGLDGVGPTLGTPLSVFLGEAVDCAKFTREFWEPEVSDGEVVVPGMKSAEKKGDGPGAFGLRTADEIMALHDHTQAAQTAYLLATRLGKGSEKKMERGAALLDGWTAALEWAFDDGVEDDRDAQLAAVKDAHVKGDSIDEMASMLADFGGLAQKYLGELEGVLDFDASTIDEGLKLSMELRAINKALESNPEADKALALRNNLLTLLHARVLRVRKAAGLVFRAHKDIARKVTSAYQRRARAMARKEAAKGEPKP